MVFREGGAEKRVKLGGVLLGSVSRCGAGLLTSESDGKALRIAERRESGEFVRYVTEGPMDTSVSCGQAGRWFYLRFVNQVGELLQCDGDRCVPLLKRPLWKAQVSPDGTKIAIIELGHLGPTAAWIDVAAPEQVHVLGQIETICSPSWSSPSTVWFSRRPGEGGGVGRDGQPGRNTGRRLPGTTDCASGVEAPEAPGDDRIAVRTEYRTQLRLVAPVLGDAGEPGP